jgi:pterin-4a-carbinolamine dehydratase
MNTHNDSFNDSNNEERLQKIDNNTPLWASMGKKITLEFNVKSYKDEFTFIYRVCNPSFYFHIEATKHP